MATARKERIWRSQSVPYSYKQGRFITGRPVLLFVFLFLPPSSLLEFINGTDTEVRGDGRNSTCPLKKNKQRKKRSFSSFRLESSNVSWQDDKMRVSESGGGESPLCLRVCLRLLTNQSPSGCRHRGAFGDGAGGTRVGGA